jgi:hypothetical protein
VRSPIYTYNASHWLENSKFSAEFPVKNLVGFPSIFSQKLGGKPKTFSPLFWFEVKNSKKLKKGEKTLKISPFFSVKKCLKNKQHFSL